MIKSIFVFINILFSIQISAQNLTSPEQFLGYTLGSRFTPHYQLASYIKALAKEKPDQIKLDIYGKTNEGRELMLVYISSAENIAHVEKIRNNNLRIAGTLKDQVQPVLTGSPAIVWLSYNVHGNEPSSSEAALKTMFDLVDPNNLNSKKWLENTVVIIDPCLNPDGRDRYVNWFNSTVGHHFNADPQSREHSEPWPGGRSNHYNFDLNRDWAWQTQTETKQRMAKYLQWLPQVHVDFHEQGYNEPYYFAPAAAPFHEVITSWQKEFQEKVGRNNARYFDDNGWLYFTKERFDLFYPSYGDTYPLYNGAIGMTYEQGGHSRGGLAVVTSAGDTLTLTDRINHHFTTGISTIEVASKFAGQLLNEFQKFYLDSKSGINHSYKTYLITSDNLSKINSIIELLKANGIEFGSIPTSEIKGKSYATGQEEKVQWKKYNVAIAAGQPHGVMAKVLLEPSSILADSNTYDITAWSIPYAYNAEAYAIKQPLKVEAWQPNVNSNSLPVSNYGYLVKYNSVSAVRLLGSLLKKGIKVRFASKSFTYNKSVYLPGTLIILQKGNPENLHKILNDYTISNEVEVEPVFSGLMDKGPDFGSPDIRFIKAPRVAVFTGEEVSSLGAGEVWHFFDQILDYPISLINVKDLSRLSLSQYTVIIMPDGYFSTLDNSSSKGKLKDFVSEGGTLIAMEGSMQKLATEEWGIKVKEDEKSEKSDKNTVDYKLLKRYENRERDELSNNIPGAIYSIHLDNSHPLAFGYNDTYYTLKQDARVFEYMTDGWNVGVIKKDNYVTGFAGSKIKPKLVDGLVFGVKELGSGSVVFMADNPLFRQFWYGGRLLFSNAVFLVGQ